VATAPEPPASVTPLATTRPSAEATRATLPGSRAPATPLVPARGAKSAAAPPVAAGAASATPSAGAAGPCTIRSFLDESGIKHFVKECK
jgi:hypothetical protein